MSKHIATPGSFASKLAAAIGVDNGAVDNIDTDACIWKLMSDFKPRSILAIINTLLVAPKYNITCSSDVLKARLQYLKDCGWFKILPVAGTPQYVLKEGIPMPGSVTAVRTIPNVSDIPWELRNRDVTFMRTNLVNGCEVGNYQPRTNESYPFPMRDHREYGSGSTPPPGVDANFELPDDALIDPTETAPSVAVQQEIKEDKTMKVIAGNEKASEIKAGDTIIVMIWKLLSDHLPRTIAEIAKALEVHGVAKASIKAQMTKMIALGTWFNEGPEMRNRTYQLKYGTECPAIIKPGHYPRKSKAVTIVATDVPAITTAPVTGFSVFMQPMPSADAVKMPEQVLSTKTEAVKLFELTVKIKGVDTTVSEMIVIYRNLVDMGYAFKPVNASVTPSNQSLIKTTTTIKGVEFTSEELYELAAELKKHLY